MRIVGKAGKSAVSIYMQEIVKRNREVYESVILIGRGIHAGIELFRGFVNKKVPVHYTNQYLARLAYASGTKCIITVHDLFGHFDVGSSNPFKDLLLKMDLKGIKEAEHIIAISKYTKSEIVEKLGVSSDSITVVYNGVDHHAFKPNVGKEDYKIKDRHSNGRNYLLFVGSEQPRKNVLKIIEAYSVLKQKYGYDGVLLKVGGAEGSVYRKRTIAHIKKLGLVLGRDIIIRENVSKSTLAAIYRNADLLIFTTLKEGFGLPVLEAMACGCPVVATNCSSIPEVGGDAVVYVEDPTNAHEIAEKCLKILQDPKERSRRVEIGIKRAELFSWDKCAMEVRTVYERMGYI